MRYPFTFSNTRAANHSVAIKEIEAVVRIDRHRARLDATMIDDAITATGAASIAHVQLTNDASVASVGRNRRLAKAPNVRVNSSSPAIAQPIATPASKEKTPPETAALRSFVSGISVTNRSSGPAAELRVRGALRDTSRTRSRRSSSRGGLSSDSRDTSRR